MPDFFSRAWPKTTAFVTACLLTILPTSPGQTSHAPDHSPELQVIRTIEPNSLRLSDRDRLSGGLPQKAPFRMASDSQGRILVTEPYLGLIQVLDVEAGKRWQIKGDNLRRMTFPTYIAVDGEDNIYVSEPMLSSVLVFFPDGRFARVIGGNELGLPFGLAVNQVDRLLYVADHQGGAIRVYSLDGKYLKSIGSRGTAVGELNQPIEIAFQNGVLTVLEAGNARFQFFDTEGRSQAILPIGDSRLPLAFALDASGKIFCVDQLSLGVLVLDSSGNQVAAIGVRRPNAQPRSSERTPTYTALTARADGAVLALRPDLAVDVLKMESTLTSAHWLSPR